VREKVNLDQLEPVQQLKNELQRELASKGRILLRPSGTEPLIRIMVEGQDAHIVRAMADRLADAVSAVLT
jgi:phosphoglucosamine mutase